MNYGGANPNVKEAIIMAIDLGITKQDLLDLEKLNPNDITNIESAVEKINDQDKKLHDKEEKIKETKENDKLKKLDQVDDESREILNKEALSRLPKEELALMMSLNPEFKNGLLKIDPK